MDAITNFGYTTVASPAPGASGTEITVTESAHLPAVPFNLVVWAESATHALASNAEIVRCTVNKGGGKYTIERKATGEESGSRNIQVGDQCMFGVTKHLLEQLRELAEEGKPPSGTAGGSLSGTYPNPGFGPEKVETSHIKANAVTAAKLASEAVEASKIKSEAVETAAIKNGNVTEAKLAAAAVSAAKIATGAVEEAKIAALAVSEGKIAAGAVSAAKIATGAVEAAKIAAEAVETAKIKAEAVTGGTTSASKIAHATIHLYNLAAEVESAFLPAQTAPLALGEKVSPVELNLSTASAFTLKLKEESILNLTHRQPWQQEIILVVEAHGFKIKEIQVEGVSNKLTWVGEEKAFTTTPATQVYVLTSLGTSGAMLIWGVPEIPGLLTETRVEEIINTLRPENTVSIAEKSGAIELDLSKGNFFETSFSGNAKFKLKNRPPHVLKCAVYFEPKSHNGETEWIEGATWIPKEPPLTGAGAKELFEFWSIGETGPIIAFGSSGGSGISEATAEGLITSKALVKTGNLSEVGDPGTSRENLRNPILAAATAVLTENKASLSGLPTVDGVTLAEEQTVLLVSQGASHAGELTANKENGPWIVKSGSWERPKDFQTAFELKGGRSILVNQGSVYGGSTWRMQYENTPIKIGTTNQSWTVSQPGVSIATTQTVYVHGTAGLDTNSGASWLAPKKTPAAAEAVLPTIEGAPAGSVWLGGNIPVKSEGRLDTMVPVNKFKFIVDESSSSADSGHYVVKPGALAEAANIAEETKILEWFEGEITTSEEGETTNGSAIVYKVSPTACAALEAALTAGAKPKMWENPNTAGFEVKEAHKAVTFTPTGTFENGVTKIKAVSNFNGVQVGAELKFAGTIKSGTTVESFSKSGKTITMSQAAEKTEAVAKTFEVIGTEVVLKTNATGSSDQEPVFAWSKAGGSAKKYFRTDKVSKGSASSSLWVVTPAFNRSPTLSYKGLGGFSGHESNETLEAPTKITDSGSGITMMGEPSPGNGSPESGPAYKSAGYALEDIAFWGSNTCIDAMMFGNTFNLSMRGVDCGGYQRTGFNIQTNANSKMKLDDCTVKQWGTAKAEVQGVKKVMGVAFYLSNEAPYGSIKDCEAYTGYGVCFEGGGFVAIGCSPSHVRKQEYETGKFFGGVGVAVLGAGKSPVHWQGGWSEGVQVAVFTNQQMLIIDGGDLLNAGHIEGTLYTPEYGVIAEKGMTIVRGGIWQEPTVAYIFQENPTASIKTEGCVLPGTPSEAIPWIMVSASAERAARNFNVKSAGGECVLSGTEVKASRATSPPASSKLKLTSAESVAVTGTFSDVRLRQMIKNKTGASVKKVVVECASTSGGLAASAYTIEKPTESELWPLELYVPSRWLVKLTVTECELSGEATLQPV